jgi:hypothetical protein
MKPKLLFCLALVLSGLPAANCAAAIIYPKEPDGGRQLVVENTSRLLENDPRFLGGFRVEELTVAEPFHCYTVGLTNLAAGKLLTAVGKSGSWQYLLLHGTNAVGAMQLMADEKEGNTLKFNGLYQTDFSEQTLEALRIAEQLPQVKKQDYELRRLDIPSILFVAVWLHAKSDDIMIPLPPTFGRWSAYQPCSEERMIKLLKQEAKKKLREPPGVGD